MDWLLPYALWLKAFHLIAMVTWFAALFYLPRLYVYHTQVEDEAGYARFVVMERKLLKAIATPGAVLTIVLGMLLIFSYGMDYFRSAYWLHAKLLFVIILLGFHGYCWHLQSVFANKKNEHSEKFFRIINEIPVIPLVAIMILAVVKPF